MTPRDVVYIMTAPPVTSYPPLSWHLTSVPSTDVSGMGLPSGVTHQQYPAAWWHWTGEKEPSSRHSGTYTPGDRTRDPLAENRVWRRSSRHWPRRRPSMWEDQRYHITTIDHPSKTFLAQLYYPYLWCPISIRYILVGPQFERFWKIFDPHKIVQINF